MAEAEAAGETAAAEEVVDAAATAAVAAMGAEGGRHTGEAAPSPMALAEALLTLAQRRLEERQRLDSRAVRQRRRSSSLPLSSACGLTGAAATAAALRRLWLARVWSAPHTSALPDAAAVTEALLFLLVDDESRVLPLMQVAAQEFPHSALVAAALAVVLALAGRWVEAAAAAQRQLLLAGARTSASPTGAAEANLRIGALLASNNRPRPAEEHFTAAWEQRPASRAAQQQMLRQRRDLAARRLRERAPELRSRVEGRTLRERMGQAEVLQEQRLPEPSTALAEFFDRWKAGDCGVWAAPGAAAAGEEAADGDKGSTLYGRLLSNASKAGRARARPGRREKAAHGAGGLQAPALLPLLLQQLAPRGALSAVRTWAAPGDVTLGTLPTGAVQWSTASGGVGHSGASCSPFFCGDGLDAGDGERSGRGTEGGEHGGSGAWAAASRPGLVAAAVADVPAGLLPRTAAQEAALLAARAFVAEAQALLAAGPQALPELERVLVAGLEHAHAALVRTALAAGRAAKASLLGALLVPGEEAGSWWLLYVSSGSCQALHVAATSRAVALVDEADAAAPVGALGVGDAALSRALTRATAAAAEAEETAEADGGTAAPDAAPALPLCLTDEEQAQLRRLRLGARLVEDGDLVLLATEGLAESFRPQALGLELHDLLGDLRVDAGSMQAQAASRRFAAAAMERALHRLPAATPHRAAQALLTCLRATRLPHARAATALAVRAGMHGPRHLAATDLWDRQRAAAELARLGDEQLHWLPARTLPPLHAACPLQATVRLTTSQVLVCCRGPARCRLVCMADEHNAHVSVVPPLSLVDHTPAAALPALDELRRPVARSLELPCQVLPASLVTRQLSAGATLFTFARATPAAESRPVH